MTFRTDPVWSIEVCVAFLPYSVPALWWCLSGWQLYYQWVVLRVALSLFLSLPGKKWTVSCDCRLSPYKKHMLLLFELKLPSCFPIGWLLQEKKDAWKNCFFKRKKSESDFGIPKPINKKQGLILQLPILMQCVNFLRICHLHVPHFGAMLKLVGFILRNWKGFAGSIWVLFLYYTLTYQFVTSAF